MRLDNDPDTAGNQPDAIAVTLGGGTVVAGLAADANGNDASLVSVGGTNVTTNAVFDRGGSITFNTPVTVTAGNKVTIVIASHHGGRHWDRTPTSRRWRRPRIRLIRASITVGVTIAGTAIEPCLC